MFLISTRLQPGESCAEKMETVSTVFPSRSYPPRAPYHRFASGTHRGAGDAGGIDESWQGQFYRLAQLQSVIQEPAVWPE